MTRYDSPMNRASALIFAILVLVSVSTVHAQPYSDARMFSQASGISQDEAAAKVRKATGGRVLDVRTQTTDGVTVYLVKVLLPDGRIRIVTVGGA